MHKETTSNSFESDADILEANLILNPILLDC